MSDNSDNQNQGWGNDQGWSAPSTPPEAWQQPPPQGQRQFTLGPMTVADVLDNTFNLFRACWKQIVLAVLVVAVPGAIFGAISQTVSAANDSGESDGFGAFNTYFSAFGSTGSDLGTVAIIAILVSAAMSFLVQLILNPYVSGAVTRIVAAKYLGRDMTAKEAFIGVRKLWLRLIGATILVGLCITVGLVGLIIGALILWVLFTAVIPVITVEEETVGNALGRSWALMKRRFWGYLGIRVLMWIIAQFVSSIPAFILGLVGGGLIAVGLAPVGAIFIGAGALIATLIATPISIIVCLLCYFDARVRNEGFDVTMMASRLNDDPTDGPGQAPLYR